MRRLAAVIAVTLVIGAAPGHAGNPWQLRCANRSPEVRVPAPVRSAAHRFFPWAGRSGEIALKAGPLYALMLSSRGAISRDGDAAIRPPGFYVHRTLLAVDAAYAGRVTLSGARLVGRTTLRFATNGAAACSVRTPVVDCAPHVPTLARTLTLPAGPRWRTRATELEIRGGCYRIDVRGHGLDESLFFAVPGP